MRLVPDGFERDTLFARAGDVVAMMEQGDSMAIFAATPGDFIDEMRVVPSEEPEPVEAVFAARPSSISHHECITRSAKGLRLSGILDTEATTMPADQQGGVDISALRHHIAADRAAGATPWLLLAAAGDTCRRQTTTLRPVSTSVKA